MVAGISPRQEIAGAPRAAARPASENAPAASATTALVPTTPPSRELPSRYARPRPEAPFVMHLIATADHAPQTRRLRQATPGEGIARYTATRGALTPAAANGSRLKDIV